MSTPTPTITEARDRDTPGSANTQHHVGPRARPTSRELLRTGLPVGVTVIACVWLWSWPGVTLAVHDPALAAAVARVVNYGLWALAALTTVATGLTAGLYGVWAAVPRHPSGRDRLAAGVRTFTAVTLAGCVSGVLVLVCGVAGLLP